MALSSDEVNLLVYRYLQESGFQHSSFSFGYESMVYRSTQNSAYIPPGALVSVIQKGLQYLEIEASLEKLDENEIQRRYGTPFKQVFQRRNNSAASSSSTTNASNTNSRSNDRRDRDSNDNTPSSGPNGQSAPNGSSNSNANGGSDDVTMDDGNVSISESAEMVVLEGHQKEVFICAWNPTAPILASGSGDYTARLWHFDPTRTGRSSLLRSITLNHGLSSNETEPKDVTTLEWSGDGKLLATGSYDGLVRVWTADTGDLKFLLDKHAGPIFSLKWNKRGDYLLSGSVDRTAIVWDVKKGEPKQHFDFHKAPTLDVDWRNNSSFATCSTDHSIYVCKVGEDKPLKIFEGHQDEVNAVKWDPSGNLLASCSDDRTAKIWSMKSDKCVFDFHDHQKELYTIKWSPTGPSTKNPNKPLLLATASFDGTVRLWSVALGRCLFVLGNSSSPVYSVAFSPNGEYIAAGSFDRSLNVWSVRDGQRIRRYEASGGIFEVCWNSSGDQIACSCADHNVNILDFRKM